jgi:PAS domain S-box-containing protein
MNPQEEHPSEALAQKAQMAGLGADVGAAFTRAEGLRNALQLCAEAVVRHLNVAFARIWTLAEGEHVLRLQASAGQYTHLDGPHSRVPVGSLKIGRIAQERRPHVTNDVVHDPLISDPAWAEREGMIAFAGYPLEVEGRLVGVLALFARNVLSEHIVRALGAIADIIAIGIKRDRAEEILKQQWRTFDIALSHTPDFTYTFDLQGRFTYVNRALLALWRKQLEEALGKNFFELGYPPDLAGRLQRQIQEVIDTGLPVRDQTPFTGPSGETRYYEYIFVPVLAPDGHVEAVAGSTRDITDRNRAEELIEQDRSRWRELLRQTPAAIAVLRGPEHRFEWVNPGYVRLVRRPAEALIGKTIVEALPEIVDQVFLGLLDEVYKTGRPFADDEALVRLDDGEGGLREVFVNFVYLPTRDTSANIDGIFAHVTDVTAMVMARRQVEEREQQFRTLAESIPNLAWMADETGHVFWFNRRWYEYTGTTAEESAGWDWQELHDPKVLPNVLAQWRSALESGEPFEMVFPLKGANGRFRSFLTRVEPLRGQDGSVVRWFGTNTDVTGQIQIEDALRKMNSELEEFAYVASHDIQEPLRIVSIYTELLLKQVNDPDGRSSDYVGFIQQGLKRMRELIQDLLTFSRTLQIDGPLAGTVGLSDALNEAVTVLHNRIEENGAVLIAQPLPIVRADLKPMAHVFQNVLSNALKYRKPEVPPEIHISAECEADEWIITIRDNGIGFQQQYAERIFGLFKRLHTDEYPGTGIGLAICKRIVERYGGRMWAEGRPGQGSSFRFSVPGADL